MRHKKYAGHGFWSRLVLGIAGLAFVGVWSLTSLIDIVMPVEPPHHASVA